MTDRQNAYFQMFSSCIQVVNQNAVALGAFTPFDDAYQKFLGIYNGLPDLVQQQGMKTTGVTLDKKAARDVVVKKSDKLLIALRALASTAQLNSLKVISEITHSKLTVASDIALLGFAKQASDAANTNITALAPFGIVAADVTSLNVAIDAFSALIGTPRAALDTPKEATALLASSIDKCRDLLNNEMDAAIEAYGISHPAIAAAWKNARKLIINGGEHLSLMIQVTDAITGEAVSDVDILIMPDKEHKRTAEKGGCDVAHLTDGNKTITAKKAGYADLRVDAAVTSGETAQLHIIMHPLA